jgi:imidazolonepropionase
MSSVAITDIGSLVTNDRELGERALGIRSNAAIVVVDGKVAWIGDSDKVADTDIVVSVSGKSVVPGFVDSHAHLVFAGDRSEEFSARMNGESYSAGGIKTTVAATRAASDATLREITARLVSEVHRSGSLANTEVHHRFYLPLDHHQR